MAAYKTVDGEEITDWNDYLERLINVFKPALLESMRVSHLACILNIEEVKDRAGIIHQKENDGDYRGAAEILLDSIRSADQPGKWQMLIDTLREVEDSVILQILLEEESHPTTWLSNDENRQIIHIFSCEIRKHLRLSIELLTKMLEKGLILQEDMARLRSLMKSGKREDANSALLLIMHRHSVDWYHTFLGILCDDEHQAALAELIDKEFCEKRRNPQVGAEEESQARSSTHGPQPSLQKLPQKEQAESHPEVNLAAPASPGEKVTGKKGLPPAELRDRGVDVVTPSSPDPVPTSPQGEATCQCHCCAQVLSRMTSLQSELDEMKALIRRLIDKGQE